MNDTHWLARFDELVESGAVSYDANQETIEHVEGDLKYHFILTTALTTKPHTISSPTTSSTSTTSSPTTSSTSTTPPQFRPGSDINTTGYELTPIGPSHFLAINKFCYARPHLMLLTSSGHHRQHEPLSLSDLAAAWTLLTSTTRTDYVVFFNGGKEAGCSRAHKHLQMLILPKASLAAFLDDDDDDDDDDEEGVEPTVSFQWFYERFGKRHVTPEGLKERYDALMDKAEECCGRKKEDAVTGATCPHNFLLTKRWMLVVPRRKWGITKDVGANSMGVIGVLPCTTRADMEIWKEVGVGKGLAMIGVPREESRPA
ncbi:5',5'''-P-1,P-4-tetraphosphate phosphorylase 2 like protein [Zymoseptoria brevis]|uniref:5',5'''-P-1,P-4-tetraphosphate phosphorylase 2 like protein n=1 Tax=Zymoseptoria brevis TaxID=1047168 RepID=A0A0F4GJ56_9PEZI|nr:5',5'''-P-1,P-4-tetraphosphate phosphorylase 2 like protein [Zymoseptoria brevis]